MSRRDMISTAENERSLAAAREALKNLPKDQERMIREAHARRQAERRKRVAV